VIQPAAIRDPACVHVQSNPHPNPYPSPSPSSSPNPNPNPNPTLPLPYPNPNPNPNPNQRAFVGVRCPSTLAPLADSTCGAHEVSMRTDLLGELRQPEPESEPEPEPEP
jgi:hypothetical protein